MRWVPWKSCTVINYALTDEHIPLSKGLVSPRENVRSNSQRICTTLSDLGHQSRSVTRQSSRGSLGHDVQVPCVLNKELNKKQDSSNKVWVCCCGGGLFIFVCFLSVSIFHRAGARMWLNSLSLGSRVLGGKIPQKKGSSLSGRTLLWLSGVISLFYRSNLITLRAVHSINEDCFCQLLHSIISLKTQPHLSDPLFLLWGHYSFEEIWGSHF